MQTKLRAALVLQAEVPPCAPAGQTDWGTPSQLIRSVGRTVEERCSGTTWGLFNLLPILPMDGGQALQALLSATRVARPRYTTQLVSLVVGGIVVVLAFAFGMMWAALLAGLFAYNNAQQLRGLKEVRVVG